MYMSKEQFDRIKAQYPTTIILQEDAVDALEFAWAIMCEEADALKEKVPYAAAAIERLERGAYELYDLYRQVEAEEFDEGEEE